MRTEVCEEQPVLVVAFHASSRDVGYDLRRAAQAFELICDLGGNGLRFDLSWFDIEPEKNVWDREKIRWYKDFCRETVRSFGITPIPILIGTPRWASRLLRGDKSTFLHHWLTYCACAIEMMDGHAHLVQVWNEANNPVLQVADPTNPDVGILDQHFFHEMLNATAALLHPAISPLEIIVNVTPDMPRWENFVTACIRNAGAAFDIIGLDYYPGIYFQSNWREFPLLERMLSRVNDSHDLWFGKQAALIEFGYSTFLPRLRTEAKQREWLDAVLTVVCSQNQVWRKAQAKSLRLISWYELFDEPTRIPLNFLAHFGIMRRPGSDGMATPKLAYDLLRTHLRALRDGSGQNVTEQSAKETSQVAFE